MDLADKHQRHYRVKVVVTCREVDELSDEQLRRETWLQAQGVIDVRRFKKDGPTMVLTLCRRVAPAAIYFGYLRCVTKPYTQPPLQCFRCYKYGHLKSRCSSKEVCRNCSTKHQIERDSAGRTICSKPALCLHCNGPHSPASRTCPKYLEEEEIEQVRITCGISPQEARQVVGERQRKRAREERMKLKKANI